MKVMTCISFHNIEFHDRRKHRLYASKAQSLYHAYIYSLKEKEKEQKQKALQKKDC